MGGIRRLTTPGVTAPVASVTLVRTISFSIYQKSKYAYAGLIERNFGIDPLAHANKKGAYPNAATISCFGLAGATAGSLITLVACKSIAVHSLNSTNVMNRSFRVDETQCSGFCVDGGAQQDKHVGAAKQELCGCTKLSRQGDMEDGKEHH
jgi:hypothetical protein